jgi:hypothetical protein
MDSSISVHPQPSTTAILYPFQTQGHCQLQIDALCPKYWLALRKLWMNPILLNIYVPWTGSPHVFSFFISHLSITITNNQDNQFTKRKTLFWLTVLEVLLHDQVASLLLGLWWGSTSLWELLVEQNFLLHSQEAKERNRKRWSPFKNKFPMTQRPPTRSHLLKVLHNNILRAKNLTLGLWGTCKIKTMAFSILLMPCTFNKYLWMPNLYLRLS